MNLLGIWWNPAANYESQLLVNHCSIPVYKILGEGGEKSNKLCACSTKLNYCSELCMMLGKQHSEKYNFFSLYCLESADNSQQ